MKRKSQFELLQALSFEPPKYTPSVYKEHSTEQVLNDDGIVVNKSVVVVHDPKKDMVLYRDSDFRIANLIAAGLDPNQYPGLRPSSPNPLETANSVSVATSVAGGILESPEPDPVVEPVTSE